MGLRVVYLLMGWLGSIVLAQSSLICGGEFGWSKGLEGANCRDIQEMTLD